MIRVDDDNPSIGTGAYALDQSWHIGWLFIGKALRPLARMLGGAR